MKAADWTTRLARNVFPKVHEALFVGIRQVRPLRLVTTSPDPLVSVLVVTNRPGQLDHVVASYDAQTVNKELVLVTNSNDFPSEHLRRITSRADVTHVATAPEVSLGAALNLAVAASSGEVLAKLDDDDLYSDSYLAEAVTVMRQTQAGIVGKKTYFVYLEERDQTLLVYPGNETRRVGRVAGGTIVAHRDVLKRVSFPDQNLGEDVVLVRRSERAGFGVFSAAPTGFLQYRARTGHTWHFDPEELVAVGTSVGTGHDEALWAR